MGGGTPSSLGWGRGWGVPLLILDGIPPISTMVYPLSRPGMGYPHPWDGVPPTQTWNRAPHTQTWDGVPPPRPGTGYPPTQTWDEVPPIPGTGYPRPGLGYPSPRPRRGTPTQTWNRVPPTPTNGEQTDIPKYKYYLPWYYVRGR